jgi:hypothetical protein
LQKEERGTAGDRRRDKELRVMTIALFCCRLAEENESGRSARGREER